MSSEARLREAIQDSLKQIREQQAAALDAVVNTFVEAAAAERDAEVAEARAWAEAAARETLEASLSKAKAEALAQVAEARVKIAADTQQKLEASLAHAKAQSDAAIADALRMARDEAATVRSEGDKAREDAARARAEAHKTREEAAGARAGAERAREDAAAARAEAETVRDEAAAARAEAERAREDVADARAETDKARGDAATAHAETDKVREDVAHARAETDKAREDAASVRTELDKALAEAAEQRAELDKALAEAAEQRVELDKARGDAVAARDEAAKAIAAAVSETRARGNPVLDSQREADLAGLTRLHASIRALDQAPALTDVLDALAEHAASEVDRVAVLLVRGDRLCGWRFVGFGDSVPNARSIELGLDGNNILVEAVRSGTPKSAEAEVTGFGVAPLPNGRAGLAVPLEVGGRIVAVLYADDPAPETGTVPGAWREVVQILVRHAARCLEAVTVSHAAHAEPAVSNSSESEPVVVDHVS